MRGDLERLLAAWSLDTATSEERRRLLEAAVEDQEVFDRLVQEDALREILADPEGRRVALEALAEPAAESSGPRRAGRRAWSWAVAAALVAIAAGTALWWAGPGGAPAEELTVRLAAGGRTTALEDVALPSGVDPSEFAFRPRGAAPLGVELALDQDGAAPTYLVGGALRLAFRTSAAAEVVVVEVGPESVRILFPNRWRSESSVEGGRTYRIPPEGEGNLRVSGPPGERRMVIFAFAPGTDPLSGEAWPPVPPLLGYAERRFTVAAALGGNP